MQNGRVRVGKFGNKTQGYKDWSTNTRFNFRQYHFDDIVYKRFPSYTALTSFAVQTIRPAQRTCTSFLIRPLPAQDPLYFLLPFFFVGTILKLPLAVSSLGVSF